MGATARKFEMEPQMQERTVLDEKIDHIKEDVAALKADVRRVDAKVDAVGISLSDHRLETAKSFGTLRAEMQESVGALRNEMKESVGALRDELKESVSTLRNEMKESMGALRDELKGAIAELRGELKDSNAALRIEFRDANAGRASSRRSHVAWMISTLIAALGVSIAAAKFFTGQ